MKSNNSNFGKLKKADFWKGLLMAVLSSFTTALVSIFANLQDLKAINWTYVMIAGGIGFLAYLQKNLFTNSDGNPFKKEK